MRNFKSNLREPKNYNDRYNNDNFKTINYQLIVLWIFDLFDGCFNNFNVIIILKMLIIL